MDELRQIQRAMQIVRFIPAFRNKQSFPWSAARTLVAEAQRRSWRVVSDAAHDR
jgi:hypothetical protein